MNQLSFIPDYEHNPGARPLPMLLGMTGDAEFFGDNMEHRLWLTRWWGDPAGPYVLSIGMNPSSARHDVDDRTIRRDINFAKREGAAGIYKVNMLSYRVTEPARLLEPGVVPTVPQNIETILQLAAGARTIIVSCGNLPKPLRCHAEEVLTELVAVGAELWAFAINASGWPKHSLYVRDDAPLIPFRRTA